MRKYIIVPYSKMTESNIGKFGYSSMSAMRNNVEGFGERKVVLDFTGFAPWGFGSYTKYTHSEIIELLKDDDEWNHNYPESY